ncbi:DUF1652 domain-containing protein [Pseudomonas kuykendallii]|uniref:DUF1652 domain-containing protein n=1 Tax=Pseudomonas kuykendallii TaxID=1007099 RepID=A0A2W5D890_9PSED|nr:DUF1652 domain-containing protein [Pseudomonas kuykendallii]PZP24700.1 MAG: hypothetical protein DI599_07750 [Pseudomonas kuykendallii]
MMTISFQEARQIIELSFVPLACECKEEEQGITIRLFHAQSGEPQLVVTAIAPERYASIRAISQLVLEIRQELSVAKLRKQMSYSL